MTRPLLGRAGLSGRAARPADRKHRRYLPVQPRRLRRAVPAPSRCGLVNRRRLCPLLSKNRVPYARETWLHPSR